MLDAPVTVLSLAVVLALFAWVGGRVGRDRDLEEFTVARGTQSGTSIGLSFFASGVGAWILFAPPEVGSSIGIAGVFGYALAATVPLIGLVLVGGRLRRVMPAGHGLIEFVSFRFGRGFHAYVLAVTLLFMVVALCAELTAAGAVLSRLSDADPRLGIIAIAVVTAAYTAYGGLRASLVTDRWQSYLLFGLLIVVGAAALGNLPSPPAGVEQPLREVDGLGIQVALTLIIAVTAPNLLHNGYWQRVWAARDQRALARGAVIGAVTRFPVVFLAGLVGLLAAEAAVDLGTPPVPFFALLGEPPAWVLVAVLLFTVALVASTVDTLQNGLAAVVVTERPRVGLAGARIATVLLTVPAVVVAFEGFSVLRLFLIADLLAAATVAPALLGLWPRATSRGALAGALAGLLGAVGYGLVTQKSVAAALSLATFADGPTLGPFATALAASTVITVLVSLLSRRDADMSALRRVPRLDRHDVAGTRAAEVAQPSRVTI
jgi:SSS family solute:Na+ symporter